MMAGSCTGMPKASSFQYDVRMRYLYIAGLLVLLAGPLGACFNPDLSQITFLCDPSQPECPEGQSCIDNRCVASGADLGATDDGGDLGPLPPSGCADGSRSAVGVAYACPGGFAAGAARQLCASGWSVCTKSAGIDQTACSKLSGFFIADVPASYQGNPGNESCSPGSNQLWYGCGSRQAGVRAGARDCQGFVNLLDCRTATGVTCSSGSQALDTTADSSTADGVLCCQ